MEYGKLGIIYNIELFKLDRKMFYFNEENILFFKKKYEMFRLLAEEIDIFIECYKDKRKIERDVYEHLSNFFIEVQNELANYLRYIEFSEYYSKNSEEEVTIL
jgi:hypothetical protein